MTVRSRPPWAAVKQNLTLSASQNLNPEPRWNSPLNSADDWRADEPSRMVDKYRDVAGLRVERVIGIQGKPPSAEPTLKSKFTFRRFGRFGKST